MGWGGGGGARGCRWRWLDVGAIARELVAAEPYVERRIVSVALPAVLLGVERDVCPLWLPVALPLRLSARGTRASIVIITVARGQSCDYHSTRTQPLNTPATGFAS